MIFESASESCCIDTLCICEKWLTMFCDYVTLTVDYCDEKTVFNRARSKSVRMTAVNPDAGVHPADKIFRVSMLENTIEIGIGAVITEEDGQEWVVYSVSQMVHFCVTVMYARSVSACFQLLDNIDVLELECADCDQCDDEIAYRRVGRVKGKITAESGALETSNDSRDIVYDFSGSLVRWPLPVRPSSRHRLKDQSGMYRITRVTDNGKFVPYIVGLEAENVHCAVREPR